MLKKILLGCGAVSSALYVVTDMSPPGGTKATAMPTSGSAS